MLLAMANRPMDATRPTRQAAKCHASSAAQYRPKPPVRRPTPVSRKALRRRQCAVPVQSSASLAAITSPSFRWELAKMKMQNTIRRARLGTALAALALALGTVGTTAPAVAQSTAARPAETLNLSKGDGDLVRLSEPMSDMFVANDAIADVQVRSPPSSMSSVRAAARRRSMRREVWPRRLCRERSRRQQHQLGWRDASPGDARCEHPGDADEQSRAPDRYGRQSRGCRRGSASDRRPMSARVRRSSAG